MNNNINGNGYVLGGYIPTTMTTTFPSAWDPWGRERKLIKKKERRDWEEAKKRCISDVPSINLSEPVGKLFYMDTII